MKWFREAKEQALVIFSPKVIPYEDPKSFDVRFSANLRELLDFYGIQSIEGEYISEFEDCKVIIRDAMQRLVNMLKNTFPEYEVIENTSALPDVWIIVSGMPDLLAVNEVIKEGTRILNMFTKIIKPQLKKIENKR